MMKRSIIALALATLCGFASPAFAQERTDQLGAAGAISNTDIVPLCQGCSSSTPMVGATGTQLGTFIGTKAVTSITTGCQASGSGTGTVNITTIITPTTLSGSNPAITTGYCGGVENLSNASSQTPTIAEAGTTGFSLGWYTTVCATGAGIMTLTPAAGTINGASSFAIPGQTDIPNCITIVSDGVSNYIVVDYSGDNAPLSPNNNTYYTGAVEQCSSCGSVAIKNSNGQTGLLVDGAPEVGIFVSLKDGNYQYVTPTNLFSIAFSNNILDLVLNPAGGLASGTITMPSSPSDGQLENIFSSQTISALTLASGNSGTVFGPSVLTGGTHISCIYHSTGALWIC